MTHLRLDPDPLTVEPEPVERHRYDGNRPGVTVPFLLAVILIIAIVVAVQLFGGSRSLPDASPTASGAPQVKAPPLGTLQRSGTDGAPGEDTSQTIGTRPASTGAAAGLNPPAATPTILEGVASWMPAKYGRNYLAMRLPRGTRVRICGPGDCWTATVNDYGPSRRIKPTRIADIAVYRWESICGVPRSLGLCNVTANILKRGASPTLPPTDRSTP